MSNNDHNDEEAYHTDESEQSQVSEESGNYDFVTEGGPILISPGVIRVEEIRKELKKKLFECVRNASIWFVLLFSNT